MPARDARHDRMIRPTFRSPADPAAGTNSSPTVLVVEDVVLVRMLICDYLRNDGFTVVEAASGDDAIEMLKASLGVDAVFADVYMPNSSIDGFGVAEWVRRNKPDIKVVLTSGVDNGDRAAELGHHGALMAKPYDRAGVARRLRQVLGLDAGPTASSPK
jgi:CheY-like chemotaxis protein